MFRGLRLMDLKLIQKVYCIEEGYGSEAGCRLEE